jgi:hypothetical protein
VKISMRALNRKYFVLTVRRIRIFFYLFV